MASGNEKRPEDLILSSREIALSKFGLPSRRGRALDQELYLRPSKSLHTSQLISLMISS